MPKVHVVEQGQCLSSIAAAYGFANWKTIYNHGLNDSLRKLRPNPHVLYPGDHLVIPDKRVKQIPCPTTRLNVFKVSKQHTRLRLVVKDVDGKLLAGKKYKLTIEGQLHQGVLPATALIDHVIPADALSGELLVWADEEYPEYPDMWTLRLGHLDPVDTLTGVQARLINLGFECGPVDGINGPRTQRAVKAFQKAQGLAVDGIPGPNTQAALKRECYC